jgi:pyrroline-5-carboxylate reductase
MKIAVLGIGNMGQALISGFVGRGACRPGDISMYDSDLEKAARFAARTQCRFYKTAPDAVRETDAVLIAVKPQVFDECMSEILVHLRENILIISIVAGVRLGSIKRSLHGKKAGIIRIMPNTPAMIGEGMSAMSFLDTTPKEELYVQQLFETCGRVLKVEEKKMDAVTGLSGSGPGFVMMFIEALADAGVKNGLTREEALLLSAMTVRGASSMVLETKIHPAQLKDQVCSPGGTTIAGIHALEKKGFRGAIMEAVTISTQRSEELSGEKKN